MTPHLRHPFSHRNFNTGNSTNQTTLEYPQQNIHAQSFLFVVRILSDTLRVGKLSLNCLFAGRNNNNFDLCRPPGN